MWKGIAYGIGHDQLHSSLETRPLDASRAGNRFGQLKPTNLQNPRNISLRRRPALDCYLIASSFAFKNHPPLNPPKERMEPEQAHQDVHKRAGQVVPATHVREFVEQPPRLRTHDAARMRRPAKIVDSIRCLPTAAIMTFHLLRCRSRSQLQTVGSATSQANAIRYVRC